VDGQVQRRVAFDHRRVNAGAARHEHRQQLVVTEYSRIVYRLPAVATLPVDLGAVIDQQLRQRDVAASARLMKRRVTQLVARLHVGAVAKRLLGARNIASAHCMVQHLRELLRLLCALWRDDGRSPDARAVATTLRARLARRGVISSLSLSSVLSVAPAFRLRLICVLSWLRSSDLRPTFAGRSLELMRDWCGATNQTKAMAWPRPRRARLRASARRSFNSHDLESA
jgi:hypothetical protein